jgi:hypothetical protein
LNTGRLLDASHNCHGRGARRLRPMPAAAIHMLFGVGRSGVTPQICDPWPETGSYLF